MQLFSSSLLRILLILSWLGTTLSVQALDSCFWSWSCGSANPSQIQFCSDGSCTLSWGSIAVQGAVGDLFTKKSISVFVTDLVRYFLSFVTIVAVVYVLWAWFQLMVSGGDEEAAKKARKIIIYVIAGIVLMWLAYWIVTLIIWVLK